MAVLSTQRAGVIALALAVPALTVAADVDLKWHAPAASKVNNLTQVLTGNGVYDFIFDTSKTPDDKYGVYNWCNMPHVRKTEYVKASDEFELQYVEVAHRHHKRTPYQDNTFPVESYGWDCSDVALFYTGEPIVSEGDYTAAKGYLDHFQTTENHFTPAARKGFQGNCQFPQLTAGALDDSYVHGADLYGVYGDMLGFLPKRSDSKWQDKVKYRVTNNLITSQVAGMVIEGMYQTTTRVPLHVEPNGIDSLEPQGFCSAGSSLFNQIKSSSNQGWQEHLDKAKNLFATLDNISGVPSNDGGFHMSFDHYYDNFSARQCHGKPLPCKIVNGKNDTSTCVTQELADNVYRFGQWEYSYYYRDAPQSLAASASTYGTWIATLANHLRAVVEGKSDGTKYYHNVCHDGSISRLLSVLQIDQMVWPGMGSEVVFELFKKKASSSGPKPTGVVAPNCAHDNCLRQMIGKIQSASAFCPSFTAAPMPSSTLASLPTWVSNCKGSAERVSSACSCVVPAPTSNSTSAAPSSTAKPEAGTGSESGYYVRVLFGGQVLKSSNPSLGVMDLIPVETMLGYFDGLAGKNADKVVDMCNGNIPLSK
ncbi:uncharacterized protein E0L32_008877 [Thyridium curvatum]|uniref:Uncharacterized protein n=1 Tax=Thyridium curvatum TaxID=1093900 RepID=A0A507AIA6_9PEZI|nr:uncharacterized protein E0L32_008877 [Thyridium curvatum]TPX09855.1 hypothetical protein E0L32_008877 [Thyridium curvatum]